MDREWTRRAFLGSGFALLLGLIEAATVRGRHVPAALRHRGTTTTESTMRHTSTSVVTSDTGNQYDRSIRALSGLALWLLLNEKTGTNAADSSGNGRPGTYSGSGITFGTVANGALDNMAGIGVERGAVQFTSGGSVTVAHNAAYNLSTAPTARWMVMVDVRSDVVTGFPIVVTKGSPSSNGWQIFVDAANSTVAFKINGDQYASNAPVTSGYLQNIAFNWDGTNVNLFVNGVLSLAFTLLSAQTVTDTGAMTVGANGLTVAKLAITGLVAPADNTGQVAAVYSALVGGGGAGRPILWSDEFNGLVNTDVSSTDWNTVVGVNSQQIAAYTAGTANKAMDGSGNLIITTKLQSTGSGGTARSYTSSRIEGKHPITTGYAEFRAKMPKWPGLAPATWFIAGSSPTFPAANAYGSATQFAELDLPEIATGGVTGDPLEYGFRFSAHGDWAGNTTGSPQTGYPFGTWNLGFDQNKYILQGTTLPGASFHTFGVYINPTDTSITFWVDGAPIIRYTVADAVARYAGFDGGGDELWAYGTIPLIPVIETEVGLSYSGTPDASVTSDILAVDYYRVYDKPPY